VEEMPDIAVLPNDQKIFSMQDLREIGLTQYRVSQLVSGGKLIKLNKSYYENAEYQGEESDFYYMEAYAPKGVICLLSAAVYYHLTTFIPDAVDVAIPRKAKVSTMPDWPQMNVHYYTDDRYKLGIETVREGRNKFRVYDMEKTVADIVFYREEVGIEETKEILVTYLQRRDRNLNRLLRYAEMLKCEKTIRGYLEVLV
jgi:predicted transcriptional regulator of viral defense system